MNFKEEKIISEETIKIIDSNKLKASSLRNTLLSLKQNIYINNINIQIIQFLGEFEYDLKTLKELFNDYINKCKLNFESNLNSLKKEINIVKKENISLKELIEIEINNKNIIKNKKNIKRNDDKNIHSTKTFKKSKIKNSNILNNNCFYDYNSFLSNLKNNKYLNNKIFNVVKYENFKQNNKKDLNHDKINNSIRAKSANLKTIHKNKCLNDICSSNFNNNYLNKEKKHIIINEIFQDEKILKVIKQNFGNEIEDKLLNDDISKELISKIEEIIKEVKNSKNHYFNKHKNNIEIEEGNNISYNLKIPKRYSNNKENFS